nr:MAG TPA: hypothetical protein [Caudoviricetes sp.]
MNLKWKQKDEKTLHAEIIVVDNLYGFDIICHSNELILLHINKNDKVLDSVRVNSIDDGKALCNTIIDKRIDRFKKELGIENQKTSEESIPKTKMEAYGITENPFDTIVNGIYRFQLETINKLTQKYYYKEAYKNSKLPVPGSLYLLEVINAITQLNIMDRDTYDKFFKSSSIGQRNVTELNSGEYNLYDLVKNAPSKIREANPCCAEEVEELCYGKDHPVYKRHQKLKSGVKYLIDHVNHQNIEDFLELCADYRFNPVLFSDDFDDCELSVTDFMESEEGKTLTEQDIYYMMSYYEHYLKK